MKITLLNRRAIGSKHALPSEILKQENALIQIDGKDVRGAKPHVFQIIAYCNEGAGILGEVRNFRIGFAVRSDRASHRAPPVHQDQIRSISGDRLIGPGGGITAEKAASGVRRTMIA